MCEIFQQELSISFTYWDKNFPKVVALDQPAFSMIGDRGTLHTIAAVAEATLVLCPLKTKVSIPDFARTVFSQREIVSVETGW